jgi:hypothetical protein
VRSRSGRVLGTFVVTLVVFLVTFNKSVASADPTTACDNVHNHQVGQSTASGSTSFRLEGASAAIFNGANWSFCSGDRTFSTIWVMVQGNGSSDAWVQSGLMYRWNGSCATQWAEIVEPGFNQRDVNYGYCSVAGSSSHFWEQSAQTANGWREYANAGSHTILSTYNSPYVSAWGDMNATFNSETYNYGTNISGSATGRSSTTGMQIQRYSDNTWASTCGNTSLGHSPQPDLIYNLSKACGAEETWTQR